MFKHTKINLGSLSSRGLSVIGFFRHLATRISHDRLQVNAGYMAYVTLLSLVPLLTVLLSALSVVPSFAVTAEKIKQFIYQSFVPSSSEVVAQYLDQFIANAGKMTAVGAISLFVIALLLISSIDKSLNFIWRVKKKRARLISFSLYWMVLTLGPVLVGGSIAVSSYLGSLKMLDIEGAAHFTSMLIEFLPLILMVLAFLGLYTFVPNTRVHWTHGLIGATCASLLFEFSKKIFAFYIVNFPTYELIYGTLATIPILFIWIYLSWIIVLFGAEITASLGEFTSEIKQRNYLLQNGVNNDCPDPKSE